MAAPFAVPPGTWPTALDGAEEEVEAINDAAARIRKLRDATVGNLIEIGKELIAVKERLDHGQFGPWIEKEFRWSIRTAQSFIAAAERFGANAKSVSHLQPTTVYRLAAPSTPDATRDAILGEIERGVAVSDHEICSRIADEKKRRLAAVIPPPRRWSKRRREEEALKAAEKERAYVAARQAAERVAEKLVILLRETLGEHIDEFCGLVKKIGWRVRLEEIAARLVGPQNERAAAAANAEAFATGDRALVETELRCDDDSNRAPA